MSTEISTQITPALHPDNVMEIEGYDTDTAPFLAPTMTAFSEAYEGLRQVHTAREKAKTNPTWNEAMQVIHTQDLADKVMTRITRTFDTTRANLEKSIAHLEGELSQPVESKAAGSIAAEVRAHIKGMPTGERMKVIQQAINEGDHIVATAVFGAPAMLSGLGADMQKVLIRVYHERHNPEVAKRLKAMQGAKSMIEDRGGLVFKAMEKAVGAQPHKVKALREAKNAAEQAFILKDA
ncbi:hypothetical protein [Ciceribacter thiooxidans]|uniref:Uncharacterized protein n=1 Tax=Ciceribacter thiooxidans TaxID=1969821 RepID=A0ABV7HYP9_9HYPH|nr:hypothetical protein [Ciceribacter thiooxidans]